MFTFDFETESIQPRPDYPPLAVGLAHDGGRRPHYLAWGHPTDNNAWLAEAVDTLKAHCHEPLLCHNAAFDIAVAHECLGLPLPKGERVNDTMFLAFLLDPYGDLGLKPLAQRYLGIEPTERDAVRDWLYDNKVVRRNVKKWATYISQAPGALVGQYAVGDVTRTRALYDYMLPLVKERGMYDAYRRECDILPMLLDNSAQGIPLDHKRLARDAKKYEEILLETERHMRMLWPKEIGGTAPDNFDSGDELAECLSLNRGIKLPMTPTGKLSTSKDALLAALPDLRIKGLLVYRSAIEKSLSTYMRPWLAQGKNLHCNWNQVRDYEDRGARTGRLSSSPNLQNLTNPEKYEEVWALMERCKCAFEGFTFPNLRRYLVAPKGMELFSHDYSQQEFRMLAHYEGGVLAERYREDPDADMHETVSGIIKDATGVKIERKPTKTINFGKVYGMGAPKLAAQLGVSVDEAYALLAAYDTALPSVKGLMRECIGIGQRGESIRTLGGRRYYAPPPEYICEGWNDMLADLDLDARVWRDKYDMPESKKVRLPLSRAARLAHYRKLGAEIRTYEYKLLNYLIQGSSADQTKEAMRLWWREIKGTDTRFLLTVHDQLVGCAPKQKVSKASLVLGECMEQAFKLDVPVKTDATYGTNFGEMK